MATEVNEIYGVVGTGLEATRERVSEFYTIAGTGTDGTNLRTAQIYIVAGLSGYTPTPPRPLMATIIEERT